MHLIAFAYVGGITMVSGAILAGLISTQGLIPYALDKWLGVSGNWALLFGGLALIVTLIANPEGVAGAEYRKKQERRRRRAGGEAPPRPGRRALLLPVRGGRQVGERSAGSKSHSTL